MSGFEAILFDKDGTLFDFQASYGAWALGLVTELAKGDPVLIACLAAELELDPETRRFGPTSVVIADTADHIAALLLPHLPEPLSKAALIERIDASAAHVPLEPPIPLLPFLGGLADRGLKLGVVTNDSEAPARAHLERSGILGAFGFIAGYDSGHGMKPQPGPVLAGCRALGAAPERSVMVGDSRHDLLAGRSAGLTTVGVLTGVATEADLAPFADVVLPDIGHLTGWIDATAAA